LIPNFRLILAGMVILPFWSTLVCSPILGHLHIRCLGLLMKITVPKCSNGVPSLLRRRCLMAVDGFALQRAFLVELRKLGRLLFGGLWRVLFVDRCLAACWNG
jgi:hypothetical protein